MIRGPISRRAMLAGSFGAGASAALPITAAAATVALPYVWRNVKVGGGGFMPNVLFSPAEKDLAYLRSDMGGAYRWDARKGRWLPLQDDQAEGGWQGIESLAPDPVDPDTVYLAAGTYRREPAAMMRSDNRGDRWEIFPVPFRMGGNEDGRGVGERLAIDPNRTTTLYFGSRHDGLQRSTDRGATWTKVDSFPLPGLGSPPERGPTHTGLSFVLFDPRSGGPGAPSRTLLVAAADMGQSGLYRSDDAGASWRRIAGGPGAKLLPLKAALDPRGLAHITFGDGAGPNGVTEGAVWTYDLDSGAWRDITPDKSPQRPKGGYMGVSLSRDGRVLLAASLNRGGPDGDTIWRSSDGGATWLSLKPRSRMDVAATPWLKWGKEEASFGWWMAALAVDPFNPEVAVYATGATVYRTENLSAADRGGEVIWRPWVEDVEQTAILNLTSPPAGAHLVSGFGDIGGFVHDDLARTPAAMFTHPTFDNTNNLDYAGRKPAVMVRSGSHHDGKGDRLAYSEDGGRSWRPLTAPDPAHVPPAPPATGVRRSDPVKDAHILVSADGGTLILAQPTPLLSRDKGLTWKPVRGLPPYARPVPDRVDPRRWYALDFEAGEVLASRDGGASFERRRTQGLPPGLGADRPGWREQAWPLKAVPGHAEELWLVGRQGLYRSTDGGHAFRRVDGGVQVELLDFGAPPPGRSHPALFAIGTRGELRAIWRSDDLGGSWTRVNDDDHEWGRKYRCLAGDLRVFGRVYVGTDGRGILYGEPAA